MIDDLVLEATGGPASNIFISNGNTTVNYGEVNLLVDFDGNPTTSDRRDVIAEDLLLVIPSGTQFEVGNLPGQATTIELVSNDPYVTFSGNTALRIQAPELNTDIINSAVPVGPGDQGVYTIDWFAMGDHFASL